VKDRFVFIAAALESIGLIQSYTAGHDLPQFLADRKTQDAVIRNLEIIGQAVGRISDSVMRRMVEGQHAVQYGYRLLHPTVCALRVTVLDCDEDYLWLIDNTTKNGLAFRW